MTNQRDINNLYNHKIEHPKIQIVSVSEIQFQWANSMTKTCHSTRVTRGIGSYQNMFQTFRISSLYESYATVGFFFPPSILLVTDTNPSF